MSLCNLTEHISKETGLSALRCVGYDRAHHHYGRAGQRALQPRVKSIRRCSELFGGKVRLHVVGGTLNHNQLRVYSNYALSLLLKIRSRDADVAPRLICRTDELDLLAAGQRTGLSMMQGWRFDVFGRDALALVEGRLAFAVKNGRMVMNTVE